MRSDRFPRGRRWGAGAAAVLLCLGTASVRQAPAPEPVSRDTATFGLRATPVNGLYPGAVRRSRVTVTNPYPYPISVRSIGARVDSTSRRGCRPSARNLRVGRFHGRLPLTIPARGRADAGAFEVQMPGSVDDACQRATFRLAVSGSARTVNR
ncbi:hypothetical protein SAMN06264365_101814 [Actinoplanes regularis]|uniref:Uncharacterized protein n=1 Tax=Actinoplanes regularis TaxID=52697 RepID=A0A238V9P4_9ACTN|nr:hypothetical protein Are01nite_02580 [Actinoplanes regularis]SNR30269.1 hypothetical protein SAMN06264365_101814 [Actinoplanes regularis]